MKTLCSATLKIRISLVPFLTHFSGMFAQFCPRPVGMFKSYKKSYLGPIFVSFDSILSASID